jgi:segregation and condensation protein B
VVDKPTEPEQFAKALDLSVDDVEFGILQLSEQYKETKRGIRVQERDGKYQLVTMAASAQLIEDFLNLDLSMKLSGPALEALAIVAYRQPVTRQQIEAVRGVDCGHVLRVLLQHDLIEEMGRLDAVGRPILYSVTDNFMNNFGLTDMDELPPLETTEADMLWAATELAQVDAEVDKEESADEQDNRGEAKVDTAEAISG